MISNKNHITRQKNVELLGIHDEASNIIVSESNITAEDTNDETINQELNGYIINQEQNESTNDYLQIDSKLNVINPIIKATKSNSSKHQISTTLREKILRSKSPKPPQSNGQKLLLSALSNPTVPVNKNARSANFIEVNNTGSFFSRSCPGEEMLVDSMNATSDDKSKMNINMKANSLREETSQQSLKSIGKSLLAFATLKHSKNKKFTDSNGSNNSNWSSINNEIDDSIDSQGSLSSASNENNKKTTKIGAFDIDIEKLARELSRPTFQPLTSYTLSPNSAISNKHVLQTSKTMDEDSSSNKKTLMRSNTQNK